MERHRGGEGENVRVEAPGAVSEMIEAATVAHTHY